MQYGIIRKESENNVQFSVRRRNDYMEVNDDHERFTRLLIQHEPELLRCALVAVPNRTDVRDILHQHQYYAPSLPKPLPPGPPTRARAESKVLSVNTEPENGN